MSWLWVMLEKAKWFVQTMVQDGKIDNHNETVISHFRRVAAVEGNTNYKQID
jgi:hypothetical protein